MKYSAALITLILLASCATPPPPATNGGAVMEGLMAAATQTTIATTAQAAPIMTAAAQATEGAMADNATRQAGIVATQTASPMQTAAAMSIIATQQAQATAQKQAATLEQVAINAAEMEQQAKTRATVAALNLDIANAHKNAQRWEWVKDIFAGLVLGVFAFGSFALIKIQLFTRRTIMTANGDPIVINGDWIAEDEPETPPLMIPAAVEYVPINTRNGGTETIEKQRRGFCLQDVDGNDVHTFSGKALQAMENNITKKGDYGFRRNSSASGAGMGELADINNGELYGKITKAMVGRAWLYYNGQSHTWTNLGAYMMLKIDLPPQQNTAL